MATGTRSIRTIPAGEEGHDHDLTVTYASWFSPDLDTALLQKVSDPRSHDSEKRLTSLLLSEPNAELFQPQIRRQRTLRGSMPRILRPRRHCLRPTPKSAVCRHCRDVSISWFLFFIPSATRPLDRSQKHAEPEGIRQAKQLEKGAGRQRLWLAGRLMKHRKGCWQRDKWQ